MKDLSIEALKVLVVLLPGFVTVGVIHALVVEERKTDFDKIIRALAYSFACYGLLPLFRLLSAKLTHADSPSMDLASIVPTSGCDILLLFAICVFLGCIVSLYRYRDGHCIARALGLTSRTARSNIWHDVFTDKKNCDVAVAFKDGRQLYGWPAYYSDDPKEGCLFLTLACWYYYDANGELVNEPVPHPGILIRNSKDIDFIQFQSRAVVESENEYNGRVENDNDTESGQFAAETGSAVREERSKEDAASAAISTKEEVGNGYRGNDRKKRRIQ